MGERFPSCPVCGCAETFPFVDRGDVPVHQNLLRATREEALAMPRGRLWMGCCTHCGFAFNAAFDGSLLRYGADYENAQTWSPAFSLHVDALVERLVRDEGVKGHVVEIGCGDGTFLRRLVEHAGPDVTACGFDPAYEGAASSHDGRLTFERGFYDASTKVRADVVVCRHVIEHVPDPVALLAAVHDALAGSDAARVYFETPCLRWILEHRVHWDLFYEHCSLFTEASLRTAFERAGFRVEASRHVFGGQYLWLAARRAPAPSPSPHTASGDVPALARTFAESEEARVAQWRADLRAWSADGRVVLFGAGAKGVTFANMADPEHAHVDAVLDTNPAKQGRFLPGTGHAIRSPELLRESSVALVLVTNPNYLSEIRRTVALFGSDARVVDLMGTDSAS